jgi:hypothetical protein
MSAQQVHSTDSIGSNLEREFSHSGYEAEDNFLIAGVRESPSANTGKIAFANTAILDHEIRSIYEKLSPSADSIGLDFKAFRYAMIGYYNLKNEGEIDDREIISIIDYTKHSAKKRFYCIDLSESKFLFHTFVSHGKNSGVERATTFSNKPQSLQSSIGIYLTAETYVGSKGYSLRLDGMEKGVNDNMRKRAVVMHSAPYVSKSFIKDYGRLGRSYGCPVVPVSLHRDIIDVIKDQTVMFGYYSDEKYLKTSPLLRADKLIDQGNFTSFVQ